MRHRLPMHLGGTRGAPRDHGRARYVVIVGGRRRRATRGSTSTEIRVGGIASPPSAFSVPFDEAFEGVKAYFDMVNEQGGVFGRDLRLVAQQSDQGSPSGNVRAAQTLVQEKKVFAVLPVSSATFTGGRYLAEEGVPAFGFNIDAGFCGTTSEQAAIEAALPDQHRTCPRTNLFGEKGSFLCFTCPILPPAFVAQKLGFERVAIIAYGSFAQAVDCADGMAAAFEKYGIAIAFEDRSLPYNFADASNDVQEIKDRGVQMVVACMDFSGTFRISQQLRQSGADDVAIFAEEGYRRQTLEKYGDQLDNWYFGLEFVPWESKSLPKGTRQYLAAMRERGCRRVSSPKPDGSTPPSSSRAWTAPGQRFHPGIGDRRHQRNHRLHGRRDPDADRLDGRRSRA